MDKWLTWFGNHTAEWLETLIRANGIHNFSSKSFSPLNRLFLSNGLRFIPTPPKAQYNRFVDQFLNEDDRGWPRFIRTLSSRLLRQLSQDQSFEPAPVKLAKFRLTGNNSTSFLDHRIDEQRINSSAELTLLDQYRDFTLPLLQSTIQHPAFLARIQSQRSNYTPLDSQFLRELMSDAAVTCKPADKNLGLALVNTSWYDTELTRMLTDRITYTPFNCTHIVNGHIKTYSLHSLMKDLQSILGDIVDRYKSTLEEWNPDLAPQIITFLLHKQPLTTATVPIIYGLIKVHKAVLSMRPIVPCTRWPTTPASVAVDHLLQIVFRNAQIPWIVKDTKSLIVDLESTVISHKDGHFIAADIASLFTNIDTPKGLAHIRAFLVEQNTEHRLTELIMSLLTFVMNNAYLQFKGQVYHQTDGTAMGTACAPTYANIVVYMLERKVIRHFESMGQLFLYRRYLDDVEAYVRADSIVDFQLAMNSLDPKLKFEFSSHPTESSFLDLLIFKGDRFHASGVFDLRVHQKSMNLYLYIPYNSFHTEAMKRSFIQTELMRYIRNSSSADDYFKLKHIFFSRLRDRGYPSRFLAPLFDDIRYSDRRYFLYPSAELSSHPDIHFNPPQSVCLLRRLARANSQSLDKPVFIVPHSPLSALTPTRSVLMKYWGALQSAGSFGSPIMAYQSYPSLMSQLVFMKASRHEKDRMALHAKPKLIQSKLTFAAGQHTSAGQCTLLLSKQG